MKNYKKKTVKTVYCNYFIEPKFTIIYGLGLKMKKLFVMEKEILMDKLSLTSVILVIEITFEDKQKWLI